MMVNKDNVRLSITIKKEHLKLLDAFIKEVNKKSTFTYNRSSLLVTSFLTLYMSGIKEQQKQNSKKEEDVK